MRRSLGYVLAAVLLVTAVSGCAGELRDALPSPTRSIETPTRSVSPTPQESTPEPSSSSPEPSRETVTTTSSPAPASDKGPSIPWLWIVLGLLIVLLGAMLLSAAWRRSRERRDWTARVLETCTHGAALRDAIRATTLLPPGPGTDARWSDLQRDAYALTQTLYRLRDGAPNEDERQAVDDAIFALQAVRSAVATNRPSIPDHLIPYDDAMRALHDRVSL